MTGLWTTEDHHVVSWVTTQATAAAVQGFEVLEVRIKRIPGVTITEVNCGFDNPVKIAWED